MAETLTAQEARDIDMYYSNTNIVFDGKPVYIGHLEGVSEYLDDEENERDYEFQCRTLDTDEHMSIDPSDVMSSSAEFSPLSVGYSNVYDHYGTFIGVVWHIYIPGRDYKKGLIAEQVEFGGLSAIYDYMRYGDVKPITKNSYIRHMSMANVLQPKHVPIQDVQDYLLLNKVCAVSSEVALVYEKDTLARVFYREVDIGFYNFQTKQPLIDGAKNEALFLASVGGTGRW